MASELYHVSATTLCPHAGNGSTISSNTRVKVSGMAVATVSDVTTVAGCAFTLPNGKRVPDVKSVAFESMTQDEFQEFWNHAIEIIKEEILPDLPEQEYAKIRDMIAGRAEAA